VKVAAIGDAHLGRSYLNIVDSATGVNQRELDFERSFEAAVDLALAQSPDVVVWLGDIFDHPRPTYRSYRVAQRALVRIREHGVRCVVITGNHDTPRLPGTGSPYSPLADAFAEFHFAHRLSYERFDLPGLVVHAVPQMLTVEATLDALAEADRSRSADKTNLLLTHPRITTVQPRYNDINEIEIDDNTLKSDLVLLGTTTCTSGSGRASGTQGPPTRSRSRTTPTRRRGSCCSTPRRARRRTSRSRASGPW
jgi:DNA repair exonuclease SbcCD nuclease subunit